MTWDVRPYRSVARRADDGVKVMVDVNKLTVIGAGAWGTTLAALASERVPTTLWARNGGVADEVCSRHQNTAFLPGFTLPAQLGATVDLAAAVGGADVVVVAVPSPFVRGVLSDAGAGDRSTRAGRERHQGPRSRHRQADDRGDHRDARRSRSGHDRLARRPQPGPRGDGRSSVRDLRGVRRAGLRDRLQRLLGGDRLRIYTSSDVVGCEISGAVKNVIAVAAGLADGLGFGMNTKAALTIRGLAELARLGTAMGGDPLTFLGLAGAGDLMATCASPLSRNRSVGEQIARGQPLSELRSTTTARKVSARSGPSSRWLPATASSCRSARRSPPCSPATSPRPTPSVV